MNRPFRPLLFLLLSWWLIMPGRAADPATDPLAEFLGKLGYVRVGLNRIAQAPSRSPAEGNILYLDARVNGRKQRWLLDTGCSITCFNRGAGRRLKTLGELHRRVKDPILGTVGGTNFVLIEELQLGGMQLANQPAEVDNLDNRQTAAEVDAFVGIDLLRRNHAVVDFLGRNLFLRAEAPEASVSTAMDEVMLRSGWKAIPLTADRSLRLFAEMQVQGETLRLLVDSGCTFTELDMAAAKRLNLKLDYSHRTLIGVGDRFADEYTSRIPQVQLANLTLTNAPVGVADLGPWRSLLDSPIDGVIGADWLGLGRGVLDCEARRLYLTPLYEPKKRFETPRR